jgi:YD repeat-containing protein
MSAYWVVDQEAYDEPVSSTETISIDIPNSISPSEVNSILASISPSSDLSLSVVSWGETAEEIREAYTSAQDTHVSDELHAADIERLKENIKASTCEVIASLAETIGDPVQLGTGAFSFAETDLQYSFASSYILVQRHYSSAVGCSHSFGPGWACNLDTRIIRGSDYRAQEEADLIKQKLDFTKEQYSASVGKREAGLQYLDNTVLPFLYEKRNKLQVAINELDAAIATASYSEIITAITNDRNNAYNALQLVDSKITETLAVRSSLDSTLEEIEKMKALIEQYSMQYSQAQKEADLAADNISLNRFTVNASDPEYATYTGNGTVTLVDESGTTRIYHIVEKPDYETTHTLPDGSKNYYSDGSTLTSDQPFDDILELLGDGSFVRTKKDGTRLQYSYLGQLSSIVDANGNTINFSYSDSGKLVSLSDDYGRVTTFTRSGDRITGIAGPAGRSVTYGYSDGRLASVTDSAGDTVTYSYDGNLLTSIGKPDGSSRTYIYGDYEGKKVVTSTIDEEGKIERFRYFPGYTEYENASGVVETYYIDERYRTTRVVHADGSYRSMEYDEHDNVIAETDELGRRTSYTYDERRNRLSAVDPAGYSERWSYAADDTVLSYTDKAGRTTWYSYDTKRNLVLIEYPDGTKESFDYDGRGRLTARTDRNGGKTKFELDDYGYICRSTDPSGASWNYINDSIGQVLQAEDPIGAKTHYEYNGDGKVVKITDDAGAVETFVYDNRKDLIRTTDKRGNSTEYKYDNRHLLTRVVNACGDVVGYEYRADGKVIEKRIGKLQRDARTVEGHGAFGTASSTSVGISLGEAAQTVVDQEAGRAARLALLRDAGTTEAAAAELDPNLDGARVIWESHTILAYDVRGNLSSTIQSETGIKTEAEYCADGRLKSLRDTEGAVTSFGYDNVGRLAWEEDPMLNKTSYTYTPVGKVKTMTDRRGMVTRYEYDRADRLISVTDAAGESEYYEYDGNGNLTQVTDKEGAKTRIRYDAMNRPLSLQDAIGGIETYEYDARGLMTRKTDKGGASTSYTYDRLGRLISVTDAAGKVTMNRYDAAGNLIGATDRRGSTWGWAYDELGRVVKEIDPYEHITSYTYTTLGDVATVTNALGETWERRYDAVGRLIAEIDPLRYATSFAYDGNGRLISVTDAAGRVEKYSYDTLGRLSYSSKLGEVRFFQYDPEGNRIAETDPTGAVHSYEYDDLGRLTRETDRLSKSSIYAYDREDRLIAKTDFSGDITKYTYDKLGRQTKVEFPDGSSKSFAYDSRGNLIKAENAARKYEFSYDLLGRLTSVRDFDLGEEITYVYDPEGARTSISWQNGKRITRYTYGKAGELLTVTDAEGGVTSFAYDELVREVKRIQSNGISTLRSYDPAGRLSTVKTEGGPSNQKKLSSEAYVYDPSGKRIYTVDEKGQITAYRYDAEGRLSEVLYPFASGKPAADFGERLHYGLYPTYDSHSPNTHNGKKNESGAVLAWDLQPTSPAST